jgi:putative methionine-R-sulfoxide reductase with GAF domain
MIKDIQKHIESLRNKVSELNSLEEKINNIASYAKLITGARRCSLFVLQDQTSELHSIYNDELFENIIIKSDVGLVGYAFHKKVSILENDVTNNPMFFNSIDKKNNFTTRNILAIPILDANNNALGVIELLNKKMSFTQDDQEHIESLVPLIVSILEHATDQKNITNLETPEEKLSQYLNDKHLYFMDDGHVYYKLLEMKRSYFLGADSCYQLSDKPTVIELHYQTDENEFLSVEASAIIESETGHILISEKRSDNEYIYYPMEEEPS